MQLSEHFALDEFVNSATAAAHGIDNTPSITIIAQLTDTAQRLETIRASLGTPMRINSGYRCPSLNEAVGGVADSAHLTGHAVDFVSPEYGNPDGIVQALIGFQNLQFDQLIIEHAALGVEWVHISFAPTMRQQVLTGHVTESGAAYTFGA